jgi:inner membrane protein
MDNLTHTLTAVALSHAGLNRKTRFATLSLVAGQNLPDIDVVTLLGGSSAYLKHHRGISDSILGATILAALLAGIIYYFGRKAAPKKTAPPLNAGWLFGLCWVGAAAHVLMDFSDSYGVRPFLPFSGRWCAADILSAFDPLLLALLAAGLGLPAILRMVSEEMGARRSTLRRGAVFSLTMLVAFWGLRAFAHRRALTLMEVRTYSDETPQRLGAFPVVTNPLKWTGVVETESAFHVFPVNALADEVDSELGRVFHKPEPSAALSVALKTRTARIFMGFARFPWAEVGESDDGFTVSIRDLRFSAGPTRRPSSAVHVQLDKNLQVRSESFSFSAPGRKGES